MQRKRFQPYQTPKKCINNTFQLKTLIKKNIKILKNLECEEVPLSDDFFDSNITEGPHLAQLIKKNKFLSSYKHINYSHKPGKCLPIFPALKNQHSLSRFHLEFYYDQSFKPKISRAFTHCTKNLKRLSHLDCILDKSTTNPTRPIQTLHFIAPLHSLSHLSLSLFSTPWLTDKSWSTFSHHLPSLKSLSLNLNFVGSLTQINFRTVFSGLSKLSFLTSLCLKTNGSELLDFGTLILLFENLKNLSHFQDLTLSLVGCSHLKLDEKDPLTIGLALLNLRKLSLEFYPNFSDSDLSELLIVLQRFSSLTSLSLKLFQFTSKGLSGLPATLSKFPALQDLNLSMSPGSSVGMISFCLKDLKELICLTLDICSGKRIDTLEVQQLCSQLSSLPKLQYLQMNFESQSRFDSETLESISQTLPKLVGLKSFYFDCWATDESAANVFDDLVTSVGYLTNLRQLGLSLGGYFDMKKETIEKMTTSLKSLNCLAELSLNFAVCSEKDEIREQFKNLIRVLESQEALVDIYIIIPSCMVDYPFREDKSFMELISRVENGPKKFHILGL